MKTTISVFRVYNELAQDRAPGPLRTPDGPKRVNRKFPNPIAKPIFDECVEVVQMYELNKVNL